MIGIQRPRLGNSPPRAAAALTLALVIGPLYGRTSTVHRLIHQQNDPVGDRLSYPRHVALLGSFTAALVLLNALLPRYPLAATFALYGALHASALVLALRSPQPLPRGLLFIAMAACLSVLTLSVAMLARPLVGSLPVTWGLYALLGVSSVTGAVTYGTLIRLYWMPELTLGRLAVVAVSCLLATVLAFFTLSHVPLLGRWWLAALWWYGLSAGLWLCERHHTLSRTSRDP
jgi:hypothetical protein